MNFKLRNPRFAKTSRVFLSLIFLLASFSGYSQCTTPPDQTFGTYEDLAFAESVTYNCITYTGFSGSGAYAGIGDAVAQAFSSSPVFSGSVVVMGNNTTAGGYGELRSTNGNEFAIVSLNADFYGHNNGNSSEVYNVVGYRNGSEVIRIDAINITSSTTAGSGNNTLTWLRNSFNAEGNNSGTLTFGSAWSNVDMVRFYSAEAAPFDNFFIVLDNINFEPAIVLPVTFGSLDASVTEKQLNVNWSTLSETNNDHFEIQVSKDGETFITISTENSKAPNGSSDLPLEYEVSLRVAQAASLLGVGLASLLLLSLPHKGKKRLAFVAILISGIIVYGCSKGEKEVIAGPEKVYIRIAQIDKDGKTSYSKVVAVKNNN